MRGKLKKIELIFKNILLKLLLFFSKDISSKKPVVINAQTKILLIRLNRIGDALVVTPLIAQLKKICNPTIHVLASKSNYFIFKNVDEVDDIIVFNKKAGISKNAQILNENNYNIVIDLHDDVSTTVSYLIHRLNIPFKLALRKSTAKLYTHVVEKLDPTKYHVVDRALNFMTLFGLTVSNDGLRIKYRIDDSSIQSSNSFIQENIVSKSFIVGVNISAGSDARFWGVANFKLLMNMLAVYNCGIVLLCDKKDRHYASEISGGKYPIFMRPTFNEFCGIITQLNILITPDTSIVHVASAYNIPTFGLYVRYKTNDLIWSPYNTDFSYVETTDNSLKNITFDEVKEKLIPFFEKVYHGSKNKIM